MSRSVVWYDHDGHCHSYYISDAVPTHPAAKPQEMRRCTCNKCGFSANAKLHKVGRKRYWRCIMCFNHMAFP